MHFQWTVSNTKYIAKLNFCLMKIWSLSNFQKNKCVWNFKKKKCVWLFLFCLSLTTSSSHFVFCSQFAVHVYSCYCTEVISLKFHSVASSHSYKMSFNFYFHQAKCWPPHSVFAANLMKMLTNPSHRSDLPFTSQGSERN